MLTNAADQSQNKETSYLILSRLTVFLSWIGIHRFYVGKYISGGIMILLFFTRFTIQAMEPKPEDLQTFSLIIYFASVIWQFYDLFLVSFGRFTDENGHKVTLHIDSAIQSKVEYGPLLVWACFAGIFGAHNFYAKKYKIAMLQLFTLGGLGIWAIYDILHITRGTFLDQEGHPIAHFYKKDPHIDVI